MLKRTFQVLKHMRAPCLQRCSSDGMPHAVMLAANALGFMWCTGGRSMVVFGGEGRQRLESSAEGELPEVYVLDALSLMWRRIETTTETADACPGACALHVSTVRWVQEWRCGG